MKIIRVKSVPATDLAIISTKTEKQQWSLYRTFALGAPKGSYYAVKKLHRRFYKTKTPMLELPREQWAIIQKELSLLGLPYSVDSNLQVARELYRHASTKDGWAAQLDGVPLPIGKGRQIAGNVGFYVVEDGEAFLPLLQPRSSPGFDDYSFGVFSSIYRSIYCFGDFASLGIRILDFPIIDKKGTRKINIVRDAGLRRFSVDELTKLFSASYRIYESVVEELNKERAGKKADDQRSLFDDPEDPD